MENRCESNGNLSNFPLRGHPITGWSPKSCDGARAMCRCPRVLGQPANQGDPRAEHYPGFAGRERESWESM